MLISIYKTALQDTEREIDIIRKALTIIQDIHIVNYAKMSSKGGEKLSEGSRKKALMKVIYESGASLPLWIASSNEPPPPLCGAIPAAPNYVAKDGDMVAALVRVSENEENWILAEVLGYDQDTGQYRVDDIDEEEQSEHVLDHERVIPLPHYRADPCEQPDALFKHFTLVLALYPHTTCFYRALVYEIPEKPEDPYRILFEDRSYDSGYSPAENIFQRYVLNFKGEESDALNN